jgi:Leucine-rich repeat (LRR) protein
MTKRSRRDFDDYEGDEEPGVPRRRNHDGNIFDDCDDDKNKNNKNPKDTIVLGCKNNDGRHQFSNEPPEQQRDYDEPNSTKTETEKKAKVKSKGRNIVDDVEKGSRPVVVDERLEQPPHDYSPTVASHRLGRQKDVLSKPKHGHKKSSEKRNKESTNNEESTVVELNNTLSVIENPPKSQRHDGEKASTGPRDDVFRRSSPRSRNRHMTEAEESEDAVLVSDSESSDDMPGAFQIGNTHDDAPDIENQEVSSGNANNSSSSGCLPNQISEDLGGAPLVEAELAPDVDAIVEERMLGISEMANRNIAEAQVVKEVKLCGVPRRKILVVLLVVFVGIATAAILGAVLGRAPVPPKPSPPPDSSVSKNGTTQAPTTPEYGYVVSKLSPLLNTTTELFSDLQLEALEWLAGDLVDPVTAMLELNSTAATRVLLVRFVLALLFFSTDGSGWVNQTNWLSEAAVCEWALVDCAGGEEEIVGLGFLANNLTGTIPTEIGLLSNLMSLDLSQNSLTGTIPIDLLRMKTLTILDLSFNGLVGSIPTEIGLLSNLETLGVVNANVDGMLPTELGLLTEIKLLMIGHNPLLSGRIPTELGLLKRLQIIFLVWNDLLGPIPTELGQLSELHQLHFTHNRLSGTLPAEIGNLENLTKLDIGGNALTQRIPTEIGKLSHLTWLSLYENVFWGHLPTEIGRLSNLELLALLQNTLGGARPTELGLLTTLTNLSLGDNNLSGRLPTEFGRLKSLRSLKVRFNQLTGAIPSELGFLTGLTELHLGDNKFTGLVPGELDRLSQLESLQLQNNDLTGGLKNLFCTNAPPQEFSADCFDEVHCGCCNICCLDNGDCDWVT